VEQLVLDESLKRLDALEGGGARVRSLLEKTILLYAMHTIEHHRGWYLESDYISGQKSKAIRKLVDKLCAELRPEAGALVNGFGIPDELLGAPIAR
jgi:acyl-CoA oxidase